MTENRLKCADCDDLFLDYFEGDLDLETRGLVDAHASSCARCTGLIRDISGITDEASALPDLVPSRELWKGIETRIQSSVVSIGTRRESKTLSTRLLAVAAAALVVISSSVTYIATTKGVKPVPPRRVVEAPRAMPVPASTDELRAGTNAIEAPATASDVEPARSTEPKSEESTPSRSRGAVKSSVGAVRALVSTTTSTSPSERALAGEIGALQQLLRQRRADLDPSTVKIVEENLDVIDVAVQQARAALQRDPASGFLNGKLDNALQKKVDLLRTVALLPSRS